jgi:hypothetical protein
MLQSGKAGLLQPQIDERHKTYLAREWPPYENPGGKTLVAGEKGGEGDKCLASLHLRRGKNFAINLQQSGKDFLIPKHVMFAHARCIGLGLLLLSGWPKSSVNGAHAVEKGETTTMTNSTCHWPKECSSLADNYLPRVTNSPCASHTRAIDPVEAMLR